MSVDPRQWFGCNHCLVNVRPCLAEVFSYACLFCSSQCQGISSPSPGILHVPRLCRHKVGMLRGQHFSAIIRLYFIRQDVFLLSSADAHTLVYFAEFDQSGQVSRSVFANQCIVVLCRSAIFQCVVGHCVKNLIPQSVTGPVKCRGLHLRTHV